MSGVFHRHGAFQRRTDECEDVVNCDIGTAYIVDPDLGTRLSTSNDGRLNIYDPDYTKGTLFGRVQGSSLNPTIDRDSSDECCVPSEGSPD